MKKKTIRQPDFKLQKQGTNHKYQLDQFDISPQDDEGGINSFQIYDSLSKQIHEGQIMPGGTAAGEDPLIQRVTQRRESTNGNNDEDVDEFDDNSFFDKRTGKKRSLTDEYQKFNAKKQDLLMAGQSFRSPRDGSTNDTLSHRGKNSLAQQQPQFHIRSMTHSITNSDRLSDDYLDKREPLPVTTEEQKEHQIGFFIIPDFQEKQFDQEYPKKHLEFERNIITSDQDEEEEGNEENMHRSEQQQKKQQQQKQNQSYYQYWMNKSINFKYKIPEIKHISSIAKLLTDFQKVTFEPRDFPIFLLDQIYTLTNYDELPKSADKKKLQSTELRKIREDFRQKFYSIINVTYRKAFKPLLTEDLKLVMVVDHQLKNPEKAKTVRTTTDSNWGCTIRVGQMMLCQALMRHLIGYDQNIYRIVQDTNLAKHYKFILKLIQDNDESHVGAFSIQNVAKMGFCHKKYPGEWYGPHAITIMLKDLNKLYQPSKNFQICIFHDGNIYYEKIKRLATTDGRLNQLKKNYADKLDKREVQSNIEFVFQKYLQQIGYFQEFKITRTSENDPFVSEGVPLIPKQETQESQPQPEDNLEKKWKNGVLVIIPTRLGLNKVNKEYFNPILSIFQCPLNVGIIGGRPNQALYFVGAQNKELILLDPHYVQDALLTEEQLKKGHLTYHTDMMKKISLSKIDTSLAFGFYLKDYVDFERFQAFLEEGKLIYKDNWLFSHFENKPQHFSEPPMEPANNYLPRTTLGFEPVSAPKKHSAGHSTLQLEQPSLLKNNSTGVKDGKGKSKLSKSQFNRQDDDFELL